MSDYLRTRFPLADTSTIYMSGKSVYNLVRIDKPGIIASVELFPADAEAFREAVRDAMAGAWDEGHREGYLTACGDIESGAFISGRPWAIRESVRRQALMEALNTLPLPDEDARSGMLHARELLVSLLAKGDDDD